MGALFRGIFFGMTVLVIGVAALAGASAADGQSSPDASSEQGMAREYRLAVRSLISGDLVTAEGHYRNALQHADEAGIRDERVASSCYEVAMIRADLEDFAEAHRMMERAYWTRLRLLGSEHPDVRETGSALKALAAMVGPSSGEIAPPVPEPERAFVGGTPVGFSAGAY